VLLTFQTDRRTGKPKIWMYKDKITGKPKGEATVTYDDANAARSAIDWFDGGLQYVMSFIQYCVERCVASVENVFIGIPFRKGFQRINHQSTDGSA
jgi:hypothetical protein